VVINLKKNFLKRFEFTSGEFGLLIFFSGQVGIKMNWPGLQSGCTKQQEKQIF